MVTHGRALLVGAVMLCAALAGSTCKVVNEDHCANQDVPGNEWCLELNAATPYCSPCRRDYHGCVDYEPFACEGYDDEIGESQDDDGMPEPSSGDEPESTGEAPASTSDASSGTGDASSGGASGSDGSGSGTAVGSG